MLFSNQEHKQILGFMTLQQCTPSSYSSLNDFFFALLQRLTNVDTVD